MSGRLLYMSNVGYWDGTPRVALVPEPPPVLDNDERYTLDADLEKILQLANLEAFDLDVAACEESHKAPAYYSVAENGLAQPWFGRVFCNPPYSNIADWVRKAWYEWPRCERIVMLIPANRTDQPWFQQLVEPYRDRGVGLSTRFLAKRTRFGHPGNPGAEGVGSPNFGCMLLIFSPPPGAP